MVRNLLDRGGDVTFKAYLGATALHWAYFSGNAETVNLLLNAGADSQALDDTNHWTPQAFGIKLAQRWGFDFRVRELLESNPSLKTFLDIN